MSGTFGEAQESSAESLGLPLDREVIRRATEGVGAVAEAEMQEAIGRARRGEEVWPAAVCRPCPPVLVVEVDGLLLHVETAWHEMKVGRVAPLGPALQHDPRSGRTFLALGPSLYCAGWDPAEEFWWRVYALACPQG